jgi:hypothetical protein
MSALQGRSAAALPGCLPELRASSAGPPAAERKLAGEQPGFEG